jgi:hypothetical protein
MRSILYSSRVLFTSLIIGSLLISTGCKKTLGLKDPKNDPLSIFDEVWNQMDKHYSMFTVKEVDWQAQSDLYRPMIHDDMSDQELFSLLNDMLQKLKDGHVTIMSPFDTATYQDFYKPYPTNFNYENVVNNYLQNDYTTVGPVILKVVNNTAYVYYKSFEDDISDADINAIFNDIAFTKGLILDVRSNTGGKSDNANKLFSRLIAAKRLVKYEVKKKGPAHDDFMEPQPFYIYPVDPIYNYHVVLLTNRSCFSACNDFAMYMSYLPNVTIMGDQTGGGGGVPLTYVLANGWKLQYTSTVTLSPDKQIIENGITPDEYVSTSPTDEAQGKDRILEQAFQSLQ